MTPSDHPHPPKPGGPIHLVVPKRPGADLDLLRAKLEGVAALRAHDVVWHVPHQRGDIVQLARDAAEAARTDGGLVVAAGGDGTINAVAAAALHAGDMRPVQVGHVNRRMFIVNASVGLYPKLLAERERASKRFGRSRWVAVASAVWSLFRPAAGRRWRVVMSTHHGAEVRHEEHLVTTLFVGNNPLQLDRMGLPQAQQVADGGHLAVVMLKPQNRWATARTVWNAATGQLDKDDAVTSIACTELTVAPASWRPPQVKVAFDGEREWMAPPLHFRVGTRPLWLVAPSPLVRDDAAQPSPAAAVAETGAPPAPGLTPA